MPLNKETKLNLTLSPRMRHKVIFKRSKADLGCTQGVTVIVIGYRLSDLISIRERFFFAFHSGAGNDGNEGILSILQSSSIIGTSPSNCLVSYPGHSLWGGVLPLGRCVVGIFYSPSRLFFFCISQCASIIGESMNPAVLLQIEFFNLDMATRRRRYRPGEGWSLPSFSSPRYFRWVSLPPPEPNQITRPVIESWFEFSVFLRRDWLPYQG